MAPIGEAMEGGAAIGIVLLGCLPMAELLRRALERPFTWLGGRLGMKPQSLTGLLVGLASPMPTLAMYRDMDSRGKAAAGAFLVSGASLLAAHMGFVMGTQPELLPPLIAGKLSGALAALALALWAERPRPAGAG